MTCLEVSECMETAAFADPYGLGNAVTLNNRYQRVYDMSAAGTPNNGVDDDYPTFAALYAKAKAAGGGAIVLPQGRVRFNSTPVVDDKRIAIVGAGSGATKWLNAQKDADFITFRGDDVFGIEVAHVEFRPIDNLPQTDGCLFGFERANGAADGAGCLDVKLHHFTSFLTYDGMSTANSARGGGTPFLDVVMTNYMMRDCVHRGIHATMMAGLKTDEYTISFVSPQSSQPMAESRAIYLGDWVDGFWIGQGNALGGEVTLEMASDWTSNRRKPAQGQFWGLSCDSGWLQTVKLRALFNVESHGMLVGDMAGGGNTGLLIDGCGTSMTDADGVDGWHDYGGWVANCKGSGAVVMGNARDLHFRGKKFISNGQNGPSGAYNNAYVYPGMKKWGFYGCTFDVNPWFGATKAGYALFVGSGCDEYSVVDNRWNAANHQHGGLFNGSSLAPTKEIRGNF